MRRTLSVCRSGLAAAAAVVLLTACGGSDGDDSASESSATTSSSASETTENSAPQADSEFCTEAAAIQERVAAGPDRARPEQPRRDLPAGVGGDPGDRAAGRDRGRLEPVRRRHRAVRRDLADRLRGPGRLRPVAAQAGEVRPSSARPASVQTYLATQCGLRTTRRPSRPPPPAERYRLTSVSCGPPLIPEVAGRSSSGVGTLRVPVVCGSAAADVDAPGVAATAPG